ncbi:unnamed protein product [Adineta ricciae]|uniref:HTH CENPB-type domain-containing protein n=1 Tax=Adineta ricciae TaxID=249248 RepID=A0A815U8T8_ADIRI|nr:unnamed protein product [Adineta ricciae]CAF1516229.1 unnamed protein product [Adineta ricciae]
MINVNNILYMFNNLVRQKYPELAQSEPSCKDHELADQLFLFFNHQLLNSTEPLVDHTVKLDFDEYDDCSADYHEEDKNDAASNVDGIKYPYDTMCAIVEYSKNHTFNSINRRYKQIKYKEQLRRIKQYVNVEGTKIQKLQRVDDFVYAEFIRLRRCCLPIHDLDLRRLAIEKTHDLNIVGFKAFHHWIFYFKRRHQISSTKVTKLVTKNHSEDRDKILKFAENFVQTVRNTISDYAADHILNSDQSSFNYDNPSTRTLAISGEKIIRGHVKSMNAVTHSYTIMTIIRMAGELIEPIFICLQESTGKLGPPVKQSIYQASNIHVSCSKSGKLTKTHIQYWAENVLSPSISEDCLLLLDSWSGQTDPNIYDDIFIKKSLPLDRYFFRQ